MNRLVEELVDMSNTCSSGHAIRLASVLNGFIEQSIKISFEDQILANLNGRLQSAISKIEDEDLQGEIVIEMLINGSGEMRKNFYKFFREHISQIREELWSEFCDNPIDGRLIEDTDFDMHFHRAVIHFTSGERHI